MQASRRTISILISSFFSSSSRICFLYLSFSIKHWEYWVCASSREWKACPEEERDEADWLFAPTLPSQTQTPAPQPMCQSYGLWPFSGP